MGLLLGLLPSWTSLVPALRRKVVIVPEGGSNSCPVDHKINIKAMANEETFFNFNVFQNVSLFARAKNVADGRKTCFSIF